MKQHRILIAEIAMQQVAGKAEKLPPQRPVETHLVVEGRDVFARGIGRQQQQRRVAGRRTGTSR
jgi:hypothetical protein